MRKIRSNKTQKRHAWCMKFDTLTTLKWLKKWDRHEVWNNDGLFGTKVVSKCEEGLPTWIWLKIKLQNSRLTLNGAKCNILILDSIEASMDMNWDLNMTPKIVQTLRHTLYPPILQKSPTFPKSTQAYPLQSLLHT